MTSPLEGMEALTTALVRAPGDAAFGVEHLCRRSALKAVNEVLDVIFNGADRSRDGIIRLRYTEFSEPLVQQIVRRAIDGCCD
jgi:hypothetical protein